MKLSDLLWWRRTPKGSSPDAKLVPALSDGVREIGKDAFHFDIDDSDGRREKVEVGDKFGQTKQPLIRLYKWQEECSASLVVPFDSAYEMTVDDVNGVVSYESSKVQVNLYRAEAAMEFAYVLLSKPSTNSFRWPFIAKNLRFHYQPVLTRQEIEEELANRPDNVVGSYAVYHMWKGSVGRTEVADKFRSGKAFHWYRPIAVDARDNWVWCELSVNQILGVMRVTVPQSFLDTATYPVVIDPTFGYTTVGGSDANRSANSVTASGLAAPADGDGLTDTFHMYSSRTGATNVYVGLYDDSTGPNNLIAGSPVGHIAEPTWAEQWKSFAMSGLAVSNGVSYWNCAAFGNSVRLWYDVLGGTNRHWDNVGDESSWNDPYDSDSNSGAKYSMYTSYTPSSAGPPIFSVAPIHLFKEGYLM